MDTNPNFENSFRGALLGLTIGQAVADPSRLPELLPVLNCAENIIEGGGKLLYLPQMPDEYGMAVGFVPLPVVVLGLAHIYGRYDREKLKADCAAMTVGDELTLQAGQVLAEVVRLLARREILPEDIMSAGLDMLPFGLLDDNPIRARLLVAQDYLEERQTLVDNILANDLHDIDLVEVDQRNANRAGSKAELADILAAAFYIVAGRKDDFEQAVNLAAGTKLAAEIGPVVGAMLGAYLGESAIPQEWLERLDDRANLTELAQRLNKACRSRELTDYVNTGI